MTIYDAVKLSFMYNEALSTYRKRGKLITELGPKETEILYEIIKKDCEEQMEVLKLKYKIIGEGLCNCTDTNLAATRGCRIFARNQLNDLMDKLKKEGED